MKLTKIEVARRQLGTATAMFIENGEPVSVHCLACGATELMEGLAKVNKVEVFTNHIIRQRPTLGYRERRELRRIRGLYWNAFKHVFKSNLNDLRDDGKILDQFSDVANDHALFLAWADYGPVAGKLPVEAQVFQVWYFALYEGKLAPDVDPDCYRRQFPDLRARTRSTQKLMLREKIAWALQQHTITNATETDTRPLILSVGVESSPSSTTWCSPTDGT